MENYPYNTASYPESGDSSPRSREIDFENPPPWEDHQQIPPNYKVKFMCSYGGKIHPRPHDNLLSYIGGETKILSVDRNIRFNSLISKLISLCDGESVSFKYQLPGEDLDALISVTNDDDLEHMMHEYDRLYRISPKPARLRIFVFPSLNLSVNSSSNPSFGSEEGRSDKERFVEALNSAPIVTAAAATAKSSVDFLFGLEKANAVVNPVPPVVVGRVPVVEDPVVVADPVVDERFVASDPIQKHILDLQRLRLEEQQQATNYRRKSNDYVAGGSAGGGGGEYYKEQERSSPVAVTGGVPYWTDKQVPSGVFTTNNVNNEQPIYMIPPQAGAYHAPMMRQVTGPPNQGYYAVQRMPSDPYRDQQQQQQMYNVIPPSMATAPPSLPPQKVAGYTTEGFGMVRPVVTDSGYAQMAYDGGMGRQVIYTAPGGVMGTPAPVQTAAAAHYQAMAAAGGVDMRQGGGLNLDSGGKVIARPTHTQTSV